MTKVDPNELVTRGMLDEAVDAILKGIDKLISNLRGEMKSGFERVNERLEKLEVGQMFLKDEVQGLKADLSNVPSRRQFEKLKSRVDKYRSLSD